MIDWAELMRLGAVLNAPDRAAVNIDTRSAGASMPRAMLLLLYTCERGQLLVAQILHAADHPHVLSPKRPASAIGQQELRSPHTPRPQTRAEAHVAGLAGVRSGYALAQASQTGHPFVPLTGHQSCRATLSARSGPGSALQPTDP